MLLANEMIPILIVIVTIISSSSVFPVSGKNDGEIGLKRETFLSPKVDLDPGSVSNKIYYGIDFPRGHIAVKQFEAEMVDEAGNPVPLHETYLHHWVVLRYNLRKGAEKRAGTGPSHPGSVLQRAEFEIVPNSGVCESGLVEYFGLGSETRRTSTWIPGPYGIEIGNPEDVPEGYEEGWLLNLHAIDTRGVENRLGCTECRCDVYNVTVDQHGNAIDEGYIGGLVCCYDGTRCRGKQGFQGRRRSLFLKYTVTYLDWNSNILPVKIYIFDITDTWKLSDDSDQNQRHHCKIEYDVESCSGVSDDKCVDTQSVSVRLPNGGDVIYGVAHQHTGGIGSALYGEDGRTICSSYPIYGDGNEAGNEAGYIVGMTTCYPQPGSIKIADGEMLTITSNYSSSQSHTGVMGVFYILVAEPLPKSKSIMHSQHEAVAGETVSQRNDVWGLLGLCGIALIFVVIIIVKRRSQSNDGYESIVF